MPIKVNSAGVVPVIFASSLLAIPATIARFINKEGFTNFVDNYLAYTKPVGFVIYVLLIFAFAYVYTFIEIRPDETAKNLKESGGYIPGIKPGKDTEDYISKVISRLTIAGSVALVFKVYKDTDINKMSKMKQAMLYNYVRKLVDKKAIESLQQGIAYGESLLK